MGRKEKFSLFDRLLAEVYNPSREFPVSYSKLRGYQLAELQGAYLDGVAHDGDILKAERTLGYEGETVDEGETVVWRAFPCM